MMWLDAKYANLVGGQLTLFKKLRDNTYNFRCPVCGDSQKDETKTRGYFYPGKANLRFKCHNCGANESFYDFLKRQDPGLFEEYKMELFKERGVGKRTTRHKTREIPQPKKRKKLQLFGMKRVTELPDDHPARAYLSGRMIPVRTWDDIFYVDQIEDVAHQMAAYKETRFDRSPRIMLPFINREGVVTHIQGRAIVPVDKSKRYITLEIEEHEPKIFGLSRIRPGTQNILVVEGPLDSLFLPNTIAMGGADLGSGGLDPKHTTFVFDNEPRNREIIGRMEKVIDRGFGVCVWGKDVVDKDINDMVLSGAKVVDIYDYITSHTFRGLKAKLKLSEYKHVG